MHVVNADLVAYVRLTGGGTVKLNAGDTVPPEADTDHVARLVESGVLSEAAPEPSDPPPPPLKPRSKPKGD